MQPSTCFATNLMACFFGRTEQIDDDKTTSKAVMAQRYIYPSEQTNWGGFACSNGYSVVTRLANDRPDVMLMITIRGEPPDSDNLGCDLSTLIPYEVISSAMCMTTPYLTGDQWQLIVTGALAEPEELAKLYDEYGGVDAMCQYVHKGTGATVKVNCSPMTQPAVNATQDEMGNLTMHDFMSLDDSTS